MRSYSWQPTGKRSISDTSPAGTPRKSSPKPYMSVCNWGRGIEVNTNRPKVIGIKIPSS